MENTRDNVIEWITGSDTITVTLSQKRFINRVMELKEKAPDRIEIITDNDGSTLYAHIPLEFLPLFRIPAKRELTEEETDELRERLARVRREHGLGEFRDKGGVCDEAEDEG